MRPFFFSVEETAEKNIQFLTPISCVSLPLLVSYLLCLLKQNLMVYLYHYVFFRDPEHPLSIWDGDKVKIKQAIRFATHQTIFTGEH